MNNRIRELALQAGIDFLECTNPEHGGREYCEAWTEQQQKFAELIVQDCISQIAMIGVSNCDDPDVVWTIDKAIQIIKQHFEVGP